MQEQPLSTRYKYHAGAALPILAHIPHGLAAAMQALSLLDERALPEWAAFAATLARRMAELLPQQQVGLGDPVWAACVDRFLLKAVDIDSQVAAPHSNDHCMPFPHTTCMRQFAAYVAVFFASCRQQHCSNSFCCPAPLCSVSPLDCCIMLRSYQ